MPVSVKFRLRVYRDDTIAIGPGKVALLEAIHAAGSISGAARRLGMSYRRAWLLLDELNGALAQPAVVTAAGGAHGGGARLTEVGVQIIAAYRGAEAHAAQAAAKELALLQGLLKP
ncbi:ModE family transcriptional regulator [Lampropedia cohaerens]|uniref:ModE family transcriptional regulator n=1 Tax=Lampropedia cohaerens TaxID=1610491 RepID=A0A0U1Q1X2_9BURK|nr:LysR family transcriptional regulator [Lampropedia cohaerens]KKW68753.1 ModE family transcriptional regulator [Lampropedia cohaerens]